MAVRELSSAPRLTALYPKAMAGVGASALRRLPGFDGRPSELPDTELVLGDAEIRGDQLAAYQRVCTFEISDTVPATYPHLLAFPLSMQLMTDGAFPFPVVGLVHIRNRIELRRSIAAGERLALRVRTDRLGPHDRGTQFDVIAEAEVDGEAAWRSVSTYLHRESSGSGGSREDSAKEGPDPPNPSAEFTVPGDIGRRYAAISGDRNPIHLHPLTARLFGLPRAIAHGMWLKARCLAVLQSLLPEGYAVDVSFKLPVFLPARVALSTSAEVAVRNFALHDARSGKPHLEGRVEPVGG
jgi:acyl dehydratase